MKALLFTSKKRRPRPLWNVIETAPLSRRFKETLLAVSYTAALLGLCWFLNKVADDHGVSSGITGSVIK